MQQVAVLGREQEDQAIHQTKQLPEEFRPRQRAATQPLPQGAVVGMKAQLDLDGEDGARISAPLRIEVAANALWGALCLLLGLSLLGLIKFLSREGDVEELARHAILERAAIQADWKIHPPPAGRLEMVARIDQNFDEALRSLAKPRGLSVVDRRIADANASLAAAREAANKLREAAGAPPGALETADLEREWEAFKSLAKAQISELRPEGAPAPAMGERSGAPSGFSPASIVISKPPVAVQLPQPDVSANRDAPQWLRRMEKRNAYGVYFIFKSMEQGPTFRISLPKYPAKDPWPEP